MEDFNAHTGSANNRRIIGQQEEETINERGRRLLDFCRACALRIEWVFPNKRIHKNT